jgi:hypothetical protein
MKGFLNKVQQKKVAGNASEGKPVSSGGAEGSIRVDISLPRSQRRYIISEVVHLHKFVPYIGLLYLICFDVPCHQKILDDPNDGH